MNARTSPSSRRSSSRRSRSSVSGELRIRDSMTRSMYSTWKIALLSAWAGPSWISWASRARSASCASTIRIWMSPEVVGPPASVTSVTSPRSRKSHVRSSVLLGQLELGQLGLVAAEFVRTAGRRRRGGRAAGRRRPRPRPRSAARSDSVDRAGRLPTLRVARSMTVELVAQGLPAAERVGVGLAVALADAAERVRAVADGRGRLRVEPVEAAVPDFGPGACSPWAPEYRGRLSWADDLEDPDVGQRIGRAGRSGAEVELAEAVGTRSGAGPGPPASRRGRRR